MHASRYACFVFLHDRVHGAGLAGARNFGCSEDGLTDGGRQVPGTHLAHEFC